MLLQICCILESQIMTQFTNGFQFLPEKMIQHSYLRKIMIGVVFFDHSFSNRFPTTCVKTHYCNWYKCKHQTKDIFNHKCLTIYLLNVNTNKKHLQSQVSHHLLAIFHIFGENTTCEILYKWLKKHQPLFSYLIFNSKMITWKYWWWIAIILRLI